MRLPRPVRQYGIVALAIPGILLLTGISTLADASPSPTATGSALPGDPNNGQTVFGQNCATCHGASLEGGIGPQLNPIARLPGTTGDPLDPTRLIDIVTNGLIPPGGGTAMPEWKDKLSAQEIKDVVSFIIQQNHQGAGNATLPANELAKRTMTWVGIGILAMLFITYLLSQYNMRWIARRAAARRK